MSAAPDTTPEVIVPARARRTARDTRGARSVSGNLISPAAFAVPPGGDHMVGSGVGVRLWSVPAPPGPGVRAAAAGGSVPGTVGGAAESVRLTARGRLTMALAAVVVALAISVGAWFGAARTGAPMAPSVPAQVVVHDGDSLWSIATQIAPSRDPRVTVDFLRRLNHLESAGLLPGQVLRLR